MTEEQPQEPVTFPENKKKMHKLIKRKHIKYFLAHLEQLPYHYTSQDQNRITLVYFAIFGLDILGALDFISPKRKQEIIEWVYSLRVIPSKSSDNSFDKNQKTEFSGFHGGSFMGEEFDPENGTNGISAFDCGHLAMTYTALAILRMLGDPLDRLDKQMIAEGLKSCQKDDGCFVAIGLGSESDVRFCFCAAAILTLLFMDGKISSSSGQDVEQENKFELFEWEKVMNIEKLKSYILSTQSYDHAFGNTKYGESHGGSTYCAVHAWFLVTFYEKLKSHNSLTQEIVRNAWKDHLSNFAIPHKEALGMWLIRRQISGFHGRPQKEPDVCYSFWVGASLKTLGIVGLFDGENQVNFTFACDCSETSGGFKKNLEASHPDVLHSSLGLAGLSLAGFEGEDENGFEIELTPIFSSLGITERAAKSFMKFI